MPTSPDAHTPTDRPGWSLTDQTLPNAAAAQRELTAQLTRTGDPTWAAKFAAAVALDHATPDDFLQRSVRVEPDGSPHGFDLLCGIRFRGGDRLAPFVDLVATMPGGVLSEPSGTALAAAARGALEACAVFSPTCARVMLAARPSAESLDAPAPPGFAVTLDQVVAAATVGELQHADDPEMPRGLAIKDAEPADAFAFVVSAYTAFAERRPDLAPRVPPADEEQLRSCAERGRLVWWTLDGSIAGLLAADRTEHLGRSGYLMTEEVVAPHARGKRTAWVAQRLLARSLDPLDEHGQPLELFGTIDGANAASRRAARDAGRREVAAWWFLTPESPAPR